MSLSAVVKDTLKVALAIAALVIALVAFLVIMGYYQSCPDIEQGDVLRTEELCNSKGRDPVKFIFTNVWDDVIEYDTNLQDTLEIYDSDGNLVVMVPSNQTLEIVNLLPNETLEWEWDQTFYLWETDDFGNITNGSKNGSQVPTGKYTAKITFGEIEAEAKFRITL